MKRHPELSHSDISKCTGNLYECVIRKWQKEDYNGSYQGSSDGLGEFPAIV